MAEDEESKNDISRTQFDISMNKSFGVNRTGASFQHSTSFQTKGGDDNEDLMHMKNQNTMLE